MMPVGLNKIYSYNFVVHLKQNIISRTTSQTGYTSTALTLNTQNYRQELEDNKANGHN